MKILTSFVAALWWGSLTTIFFTVPMLFANLPTPALAGNMAAKLFTVATWMTVVCALLLLIASRPRDEGDTSAVKKALASSLADSRLYLIAGMLFALLVEFVAAPHIIARENLALWHRVGTLLYFLQWVCAGGTLWKLVRQR